jgi:16S rRNA (guanine966-N2)-methyltransferase
MPMPSHRTSAPPAAAKRQVRIIGGQWKRTPLPVVDQDGLRPTPDRVRETIFNWLSHLFDGGWSRVRCLDLFAGTGALGMEAASRGAAEVTMVESSPAAVRQLEANKAKLGAAQVAVVRGDAARFVQQFAAQNMGRKFDLIFFDPPYQQDWLPKLLPACRSLLADAGYLYVEAEMPLDAELPPDWLDGWTIVRADKAGMVHYHLLQSASSE